MSLYSLRRRHAAWLLAALLGLEAVVLAVVVGLWMWPMGKRAAQDLAALMVLSAQTWVELPPMTRPALEVALLEQHGLWIGPEGALAPPPPAARWQPPFFALLQQELSQRLGQPVELVPLASGPWPAGQAEEGSAGAGAPGYAARLAVGGRWLWVGVSAQRAQTRPLLALAVLVALGAALAWVLAGALARRVVRPLKALSVAMAEVGGQGRPQPLPEPDAAELAELVAQFNHMAERVRRAQEDQAMLLAGVSHDLRTPLARLSLAVELMRTQPQPQWLKQMQSDVQAMEALVQQVLALRQGGRPEAAQRGGVAEALEAFVQGRPEGCVVQRLWPAALEPRRLWRVPPLALQRVVGNLLDNACRYAPGQPVELAWMPTGEDGSCRIEVRDRGPGDGLADLEGLFEPFRRGDAARQAQPGGGGVGLGLAIVRQLALAHGWQVGLERRAGGGLVAWVQLPPGTVEGASEGSAEGGEVASR